MCLWCGYLQWKWNNENSAQAEFHHLLRVVALLLCQVALRQQGGLARSRMVFSWWRSSWTFPLLQSPHWCLSVPTRSAGQAIGAVRRKKKVLFQFCGWGQPVLYRPHSPHLHSPTALNYPLRFLRETEWQLGPVQQWESCGSCGLAEKSIYKWINCTNNSS